jgi:hypothetical protein
LAVLIVLGRAYEDYRLDGFSMWLRGYVSDDLGRWEKIKACLAVSDTCKKLWDLGRWRLISGAVGIGPAPEISE